MVLFCVVSIAPSMMSLRQRHMDSQLAMGSQRLVETCLLAGQQGDGTSNSTRELNRSDSDSSLSLSQIGDRLSAYSSKGHLVKPTSFLYGQPVRSASDEPSLHAHTPNGGNRVHEGGALAEPVPESPILMKKVYSIEKSASLGEMNVGLVGMSMSESSRSLSPNSTDADTPSPTGGQPGATGTKGGSRVPQLSSKKSPLEEDSGSTGEDTDSVASRKKHTFKIFKKQKK
nr:stromal interaction molecule 1-like isoform X2 [Oncorhynchus nerka]